MFAILFILVELDTYVDAIERISYEGTNRRTIKKGRFVSVSNILILAICLIGLIILVIH